jgi:predicted RNase H-like nuclease (RuvC/YqgF family)
VGYDFDGIHVPVDGNDNYSLVYGAFVVPLVKAVQEQQKMIEEFQVTNDELRMTNKEFQITNEELRKKNDELQKQIDEIKVYLKR